MKVWWHFLDYVDFGCLFFAMVFYHRIAISSTPCYLISLSYSMSARKAWISWFLRSWSLPVGSLESTLSGSITWMMPSDPLYLIITNHQADVSFSITMSAHVNSGSASEQSPALVAYRKWQRSKTICNLYQWLLFSTLPPTSVCCNCLT